MEEGDHGFDVVFKKFVDEIVVLMYPSVTVQELKEGERHTNFSPSSLAGLSRTPNG